jgi:GNAT superfamily N-acetyltransferase
MTASKAPGSLEYRYAELRDTARLVEHVESAYRGDSSRVGWTTEADLLEGQRTDAQEIEEILGNCDARLLLAQSDDKIVGCVLFRRSGASVYIGMLAVVPNRQGGGIGRGLLREAERRAKSEFGLTQAYMTVIEQRGELIDWYVRRGYVRTTRTEPFPYGDRRFGLPKRPDLRFVVLEKSL